MRTREVKKGVIWKWEPEKLKKESFNSFIGVFSFSKKLRTKHFDALKGVILTPNDTQSLNSRNHYTDCKKIPFYESTLGTLSAFLTFWFLFDWQVIVNWGNR